MNQSRFLYATIFVLLCKHFVIASVISYQFIEIKRRSAFVFRDKISVSPFLTHLAILTERELTVDIFGIEFVRKIFHVYFQGLKFRLQDKFLLITTFYSVIRHILNKLQKLLSTLARIFCILNVKFIVFTISVCEMIKNESLLAFDLQFLYQFKSVFLKNVTIHAYCTGSVNRRNYLRLS